MNTHKFDGIVINDNNVLKVVDPVPEFDAGTAPAAACCASAAAGLPCARFSVRNVTLGGISLVWGRVWVLAGWTLANSSELLL